MGKLIRTNTFMVNTEHRKIHKQSGELEVDCREVSEGRLIKFTHTGKVITIRKIAMKVGMSEKGSKLDIINRVKHALRGSDTKFTELVKTLWRCVAG